MVGVLKSKRGKGNKGRVLWREIEPLTHLANLTIKVCCPMTTNTTCLLVITSIWFS